jgi:hypothetical protein
MVIAIRMRQYPPMFPRTALVTGGASGIGAATVDLLQAPRVGILRTFVVEVNLDGRSSALARIGARDFLDIEASLAVAGPFVGLLFASLAGGDLDLVSDHEDRIESDAELAYEVRVLAGIARKLCKEVFGA